MEISFQNVVPIPLKEAGFNKSDVWDLPEIIFRKGESNQIKAPSGVGKTTLLSIMYGIRRDYTGKVEINNEDIAGFSLNKWAGIRQKQLAYIFQGLELFSELTVIENIQMKNMLTNFLEIGRIEEMADRLNVKKLLNRKASTLSFGQKQRIAIIRALCQPFDFIFLDEPFSHLDKENISLVLELLKEECDKQKAGLILSSLDNDYGFNFDNYFQL